MTTLKVGIVNDAVRFGRGKLRANVNVKSTTTVLNETSKCQMCINLLSAGSVPAPPFKVGLKKAGMGERRLGYGVASTSLGLCGSQ